MAIVPLHVHHSQFPDRVRAELIHSLRSRRVNHKFHYDSIKQANKWLALHEKYSPARTDPDCLSIYDTSYSSALQKIGETPVCIIGLGCGGGHKEAELAKRLKEQGRAAHFLAVDVSAALVLSAHQRVSAILGAESCSGLVCDLGISDDIPEVLNALVPAGFQRLVTFFGMIPNFEPEPIVSKLARLVRVTDTLLFSANLAPGKDYRAGVERVFPLYDNLLTREWLMTFLGDLGVERGDGELEFSIEAEQSLLRIAVAFRFDCPRELRLDGECFVFSPGDRIRLFFSYRHTPKTIDSLLARHGLQVVSQWVAGSEEEGVFLCRRNS